MTWLFQAIDYLLSKLIETTVGIIVAEFVETTEESKTYFWKYPTFVDHEIIIKPVFNVSACFISAE